MNNSHRRRFLSYRRRERQSLNPTLSGRNPTTRQKGPIRDPESPLLSSLLTLQSAADSPSLLEIGAGRAWQASESS